MKYLVGLDIGGTKCAVVLGRTDNNQDITILDRMAFPTGTDKGVQNTLDNLYMTIDHILEKHALRCSNISGVGISCGGPLDSRRGLILSPPNLPGWDNISIVSLLEDKYGIKTSLQNDANACALAEWKFGAGRGFSNMIFLTFGTGMGAGLILGGRLYSGTSDMAGEVGHIRLADFGPVGFGKAGSFEGFCSGGGIAQLSRVMVMEKLQMGERVSFCESLDQLGSLTAKVVGDAAEAGDELASEIYGISGRYLGRGLALLVDILNPEVIIIGSIFARSRELLWPVAQEVLEAESLGFARKVCSVVPAALGEKIGDYAALAVALNGQGDSK